MMQWHMPWILPQCMETAKQPKQQSTASEHGMARGDGRVLKDLQGFEGGFQVYDALREGSGLCINQETIVFHEKAS